ncbi:two-component system, OmpR family, phosphate regulon sensor histidine kinase PhoR [Lutibacter oricola]|uniref:histidine kinase n=1 Tax=Lutibacter oricola TaxID=762486 RepID=A0A1H2TBR9_9FLAO|nr:HAMP domain-containing sensor histidine kinase [Lutibacter oricola]SDW41308.1 two-component system, OmpR family, phosphate regulon sensor histidine kinase PhoR [Lutibacter oricola]
MNNKRYQWIIYIIASVIVVTIAVQVYWNYREYQLNKKHLISKVRQSLDSSVEDYFANITKSSFIITSNDSINSTAKNDTIKFRTKSRKLMFQKIDSTLLKLSEKDSTKVIFFGKGESSPRKNEGKRFPYFKGPEHFTKNIDSIISKVIVSFSKDTLDLEKLNNHISKEFERQNIHVKYALKLKYKTWFGRGDPETKSQSLNLENFPKKHLTVTTKSHSLPHRSKLELYFTNSTVDILKESLISILLSFLLSASVIASIVYLLRTINKQKQLAEVKNDLISNITHEFKTPIATISTVLEAMRSFNVLEDKEKSEKYVGMATTQTKKLHLMVEKLLETASLKQEELKLSKEPFIVNELLESIVGKYKMLNPEKVFNFDNNNGDITINVDAFHFENAISNIIENAVKYGGDKIYTEQKKTNKGVEILIWDNGDGISKNQKDKVFEQFYRVSTGNTHNVKGFGIGLYYTKKIIEKHNGKISIVYNNKGETVFKIELLND